MRCEHERDRIIKFFDSLIKWYKLKNDNEIKLIKDRCHYSEEEEEEQEHQSRFHREMKRSLESYFSKTQMSSFGSRYYSTVNGYDFMAVGVSGKPVLSSVSLPSSANSSINNSLSKKINSKRATDFGSSSYHSSQNNSANHTHTFNSAHIETVVMRDLIEYDYHPQVPRLLQILCRQLVNLKGYNEEGIFRISAGVDEQTRLRCAISSV